MSGRPRVLIVEPDPWLALETVRACLAIGLEPKLCRGASNTGDCAGLDGLPCPRASEVVAALVTVIDQQDARAAAACAGNGRLVVATDRPKLAKTRRAPEAFIDYPYEPASAAALLFDQAKAVTKERLWTAIRVRKPSSTGP